MWVAQSISPRGLDCVEIRAFKVSQRISVPQLGFILLNVAMYSIVWLCIVYSCYVYYTLAMYILVSVLGNGPASRGLFHSNWVVRETSGSSGKHLGRQGYICFSWERHGYLSDGRTAGRSDGRSDGESWGSKKLNPNCLLHVSMER